MTSNLTNYCDRGFCYSFTFFKLIKIYLLYHISMNVMCVFPTILFIVCDLTNISQILSLTDKNHKILLCFT